MGKYVTSVASTTVVLIEDTPNIVQQSVINSINKGTNIASDLLETVSNTYAQQVHRAYTYARDTYVYGLPEGTFGRINVDTNKLKPVMATFVEVPEGGDFHILSAQIAPLILTQFGNEAFSFNAQHPYDFATDTVANVEVHHGNDWDDNLTLNLPINTVTIPYEGGLDCHFIHYAESGGGDNGSHTKVYQGSIRINQRNTDYNILRDDPNVFYYYTVYQVTDKDGNNVGLPKLWNYYEDANKYPTLNLPNKILQTNQYMPIIPLRVNNNTLYDTDEEKKTDAYKTSKQLLKLLDLNIDQLTDAINDNPDVGDIDHAYITLGVNLFTEKRESLLYMFEFFKYMHTLGQGLRSSISIYDETYHTVLSWDESSFREYKGSIGEVNHITKAIHASVGSPSDYVIVQKQVDKTTVQEFVITDLVQYNYIYSTGMSVTTSLSAPKGDGEALCIPINISIVESVLSPLQANTLYYDAIRIMFNSFERTKLKWYQTGLFQIVTIIVAVAITYFSGGTASGFAAALIGGIVINLALQLLVKFSIKLFGDKVGKIVAAVAAVAAIVYGFISGYIPDVSTLLNIGLQVGTNLANQFTAIDIQGLESEIDQFNSEAEEKQDILAEAQSKLDDKTEVDPFGIFESVGMVPRQTIDEYFYTKLELPINAGTVAIDTVSNWVDSQLTLPKFN